MNNRYDAETAVINKGEMFSRLVESDLYQMGIKEAKERLFELFEYTNEEQTQERENIYYVMKALQAIENSTQAAVSEGEMAADYREAETDR